MLEIYQEKQPQTEEPIRLRLQPVHSQRARVSLVDKDGDELWHGIVLAFVETEGKIKLELAGAVDDALVHVDKDGYIKVEFD